MSVITVNRDNFEEVVLRASGPVLVDFWASWCGPCTMLSPIIDELAREHPELTVGKINVDEQPELSQQFQISVIPTVLAFQQGKQTGRTTGLQSKQQLAALLK